ncbi:MAG: class I adenylate-forming enzyme family protein [Candidatus Izemoplasmatales bacterium]|nr:class I adenylate-forming enzyme family protein [Candidatus Izemoplasmatales bacterium]MDD3865405.1 class I adenylate-forming enzyme family protein [Candidatus Izemoplasmatales bacterium]
MNPRQSLYAAIMDSSKDNPKNKALLFMGKYITYQTLIKRIDQAAGGLKAIGIKKGDVVTICMPNIFACVYAFYACNKIGAICHMVHPLTPLKQMEGFLETTNSHYLFIIDTFYDNYSSLLVNQKLLIVLCNPVDKMGLIKQIGYAIINRKRLKNINFSDHVVPFKSLLASRNNVAEDAIPCQDDAVYLHSGGTSGKPKTIALSSFAINSLAMKTEYILDEKQFQDKTMLAVLPMFHGFGLCMGVHALLCFGGCDALMPKFNAYETIALLKKNRVNYIIGVPSLFENLLSKPEFAGNHLGNLHQAFVGGDFVSPTLKMKFDDLMHKWKSKSQLLEGYGLTEVVTVCCVNTLKDHRNDSVGRPLPGFRIKIVDLETRNDVPIGESGEIAVAGDTRMNGYFHDQQATDNTFLSDPDGTIWVLTGDYGYMAADGHLHFKQRLKRIVKVSGIPIMPSEIEALVTSLPGVAEAAAIGIDDVDKGHMIKLFIKMKPDAEKIIDADFIKLKIKEELSIYAVPKTIEYLEEMPHTIVGKIDTIKLEAKEKQ